MLRTVKYQIATYSGEVSVNCDPDDDNEMIIARAKKIIRQKAGGYLPFGYEHFEIVEINE